MRDARPNPNRAARLKARWKAEAAGEKFVAQLPPQPKAYLTLPYYVPADAPVAFLAMAALDVLLMKEHHWGMAHVGWYRDRINEKPVERRDIIGLNYQRARFERQSARRHQQIWRAIREHKEEISGPRKVALSPFASGKRKTIIG